jgi:DNA mismatch repair protein MutS2
VVNVVFMNITSEVLSLLEFDKLRNAVSSYAFSVLGKEKISSITPFQDEEKREEQISLVGELRSIFGSTDVFPVPQGTDIRPIINRVNEGVNQLSPEELIIMGRVTESYWKLGEFLSKLDEKYEDLSKIGSSLKDLPNLQKNVISVFEEDGTIKDNASLELKRIRKGLKRTHGILLKTANKVVSDKKRYLQEEIFTTREERIVIPVIHTKRKNVPGIVQGISQTQNTIFIEPVELIDLNNDLSTLRLQEEREIKRLLQELTSIIRDNIESYENAIVDIGNIDKLYAIASFSERYDFSIPVFSKSGNICIRGGYHPLLMLKKGMENVVPFDIKIDENSKTLLISGSNMGGKTVFLKSVGIIMIMAFSGMHIPALKDSKIPEIDTIFADIGDEQSIERDLSTFSSHIKNIVQALNNATHKSLVLLDEIGVGTDPEEGMGIAMATLEKLTARGVITMATTHYGKLKHFVAEHTPRMINASMDFDSDTGKPTYNLRFGIPGSSHGFTIAGEMGFPLDLLQRAESFVDERELKTDKLLCSLEKMMKDTEEAWERVEKEKKNLERLMERYKKKYRELKDREKEFTKDAKKKAEELVYQTRKDMENIVREIRESQASKEKIKKGKELIKSKIKDFAIEEKKKKRDSFSSGDYVYSNRLKTSGRIVEVLDGYARVEGKDFRFLAPFDTLEKKEQGDEKKGEEMVFTEIQQPGSRIDIRGFRAEDAKTRVVKLIDSAVLAGLKTLHIIHGKGTGILRETVSELLKKDKRIAEYRLGNWNEGGTGVTIVTLK